VVLIKPLGKDFTLRKTPGTVKPYQVSLVEPVAYQFQLHLISGATKFGVVLLSHDERAFVASIEIRRLMTSQRVILQKV
jgi:hypothetical protein